VRNQTSNDQFADEWISETAWPDIQNSGRS